MCEPPVLRFVDSPASVADAAPAARTVVLDTAWTRAPAAAMPGAFGVRESIVRVLAKRELFDETTRLLDAWEEAAGIAEALIVDGVSYWYRHRLVCWRWLLERLIWIGVLDDLLDAGDVGGLEVPGAGEPALAEVAQLVADSRGLSLSAVIPPGRVREPVARRPSLLARLRWRLGIAPRQRHARRTKRRHERMERLFLRLVRDGARTLLVLVDPATRQIVETEAGRRRMDPFLGPVVDALGPTNLKPLVLELGSRDRQGSGGEAALTEELLSVRYAAAEDEDDVRDSLRPVWDALHRPGPLLIAGRIDLGPLLLDEIRGYASGELAQRLVVKARARRLMEELRPAGLLLINEYGRTEWLAAARQAGVSTAAVQHGIIHPWHVGYLHARRPASLLRADRTYLFGDYERRLLTERSVYADDELRVVGSPRLDVAAPILQRDRAAVRASVRRELGIAPGHRLLLVSGTVGVISRFHAMAALVALVDRPLPRVHLVVKVHPGDRDDGALQALLAGLGHAGGFAPPPLTVVKEIDLYRLLRAADAHLGLYSTVLSEAVVAGTPNLVCSALATHDLLGYVASGAAQPVRDGSELLAALDVSTTQPLAADTAASFLAEHFAPGPAAPRIAADLGAWVR